MAVAITVIMITAAPRLIARFGPKALVVTGTLGLGAGLGGLSPARSDGDFWTSPAPHAAGVGAPWFLNTPYGYMFADWG